MDTYLYISFYTTAEAIATERAAKKYQVSGKLVPIPRRLSAGCGMAFRTDVENYHILESILASEDIEYEEFRILN